MELDLARPASPWLPPRRFDGVAVGGGFVPPGTRFRRHAHEGAHLCIVVHGGFIEATPSGPIDVAAGTVRISSAARHDIDFAGSGAACVVIDLDADAAASLGRPPARPRFLSDPWLGELGSRVGVLAARRGRLADLELDGALVEFLAQVARRHSDAPVGPPPSWVRLAREMVHDFGGRQSLSGIAEAIGVHRVHLARAFRGHYGEPIGRLARRLRLERALRLLEGDLPLAQIAAAAGYADQSHLTREITRFAGVPPARLRRVTPIQDTGDPRQDIRDERRSRRPRRALPTPECETSSCPEPHRV